MMSMDGLLFDVYIGITISFVNNAAAVFLDIHFFLY